MGKDPAFLFYASDFLTGTMFFSNEQVGKYIKLLCSQHQHGGFIEKNSFENLVGDDKLIRSKFIETEYGFYNVRLSEEMENRNEKSKNISDAAKETWKKRRNSNTIVSQSHTTVIQSYNNGTQLLKEKDTIVIPLEDEDERVINSSLIKNSNIKALGENFELAWYKWKKYIKEQHNKKMGDISEETAKIELMKLARGSEESAIIMINRSIANGWKSFIELQQKNSKSIPQFQKPPTR